jgi:polar amino acid transport system substrate-binding protein
VTAAASGPAVRNGSGQVPLCKTMTCRLPRPLILVWLCCLVTVGPGSAWAQEPPAAVSLPASVKVGVLVLPPFVERTQNGYAGMAIDLWQDAASKIGVTYQYQAYPSLPELLDAVSARRIDVVVGNIAITEDRLLRMDFTQPWFDSGQRVMVDQSHRLSLATLFENLERSGHLEVYLWIAILIALATVGLTIFDRYFDEEFHKEWHKGFIESFYHVISVTTSGKTSHKRLFGVYGRIIAALWMICGLAVIAYVTSSITSVMTTASLTSQVTSKANLPGKTVGVLNDSVGQAYCFDEALTCVGFDTPNQLAQALRNGTIDAVIGDAATLEYYAHTHPRPPVTVVGALFRPEKIGFATPLGSPLTRPLTLAIVADMQNGLIDRLRAKYFGEQD